jgi:hypothetical protein
MALTGLIRQTEDQKKAFGEIIKPDFIADGLPGAFKKISKNERGMATLREKQHE